MAETAPRTHVTRKRKRWQDLSPAAKTRITAQSIEQAVTNLLLLVWAVGDLRRRSDSEINVNKKVWMLVALATPIGPIIYFLFGRKRGTRTEEMHVIDKRIGE